MKRIYIAIIALAAACTPATVDNRTPQGDPSDEPSADAPADPSASPAAFDPTGCVKTVTKETWVLKSSGLGTYMSTKQEMTVTYDSQGRPEQQAYVTYGYDENGESLPDGFGLLKRNEYYFYSEGHMEIRQHPEPEAVIYKADLDANGCITHYESGYMDKDVWKTYSSGDCHYMDNPDLEGYALLTIDNLDGLPSETIPWEFTWDLQGCLVHAHQKWGPEGPEELTDDESRYYIYSVYTNTSYGKAYDISGLLIDDLDPYGFKGRGCELLPSYANTTYRNKAYEFDYEYDRQGPLHKATVDWYPFADDSAMASVKHTYVYTFTYYE